MLKCALIPEYMVVDDIIKILVSNKTGEGCLF